ncbi:MAG TPA: trypsin-like peptidase domain-containing protein, partial [Elainellaceae cyanobacterium]
MGSSSIYELFQRCTVRIETDRERGTGFFVAPGLVLTCEHVVKGVEVGQLRLRWGDVEPQVTAVDADEALDLALLTLESMEHPCVKLAGEVTPGDRLYSYGYPDPIEKRDGASLTMEAEGTGDRGQILSLKGENIRPGFSGAAVLNQTSLSVCGLVQRERGAVAVPSPRIIRAIGGVAVPLEVILERWPELAERNRAFHQQDDSWAKAVEQELERRNTGFQVLLGRIEAQMVSQADLDELRDAIKQGQSALQQLGKYNINIGHGQDIRVGDDNRTYNTVNLDDAAIQVIVEAIQQRSQLSGIPNNLPRSGAQKFVGRDAQLSELHELLQHG